MLTRFFISFGRYAPYLLAVIIPALAVVIWFKSAVSTPLAPGADNTIVFQVQPGWSTSQIANALVEKGIVKSSFATQILIDRRKGDKQILGAEFSLSPALTAKEIVDKLLEGQAVEYEIVLPEGVTVAEATKIITGAGLVSEEEISKALRSRELMARLGIPALVPEGYIYQGTYKFTKPITGAEIVTAIVEKSRTRIEGETVDFMKRSAELGFLPYQVLKVASIVEKESPRPELRKQVASMIHNRLRIGMPLESEKTLRYNLQDQPEEFCESQKAVSGPYNTFLNRELPATPICTPSGESILATLYPDNTDYLYIFRRPDGEIDFSATKKQHEEKIKTAGINSAGDPKSKINQILND